MSIDPAKPTRFEKKKNMVANVSSREQFQAMKPQYRCAVRMAQLAVRRAQRRDGENALVPPVVLYRSIVPR
jgi:hypothetical protein